MKKPKELWFNQKVKKKLSLRVANKNIEFFMVPMASIFALAVAWLACLMTRKMQGAPLIACLRGVFHIM